MAKTESISAFYQRKFDGFDGGNKQSIGHFNVFKLEPHLITPTKSTHQRRRDYFNVILILGTCKVRWAEQTVYIKEKALIFCHPDVLYSFEENGDLPSGYFFVFNKEFFHGFDHVFLYPVFQPIGIHVFELDNAQLDLSRELYEKLLKTNTSEYILKYDLIRCLVLELAHLAMIDIPSIGADKLTGNASQRITRLFLDLLARQFPIEDPRRTILLRSAADYATELNIHVNHLNRSLKECTDKTSTELIAERLVQEAKVLLKHSSWTISEIAGSLGFSEVTYFNSFFKKHSQMSPSAFRNI